MASRTIAAAAMLAVIAVAESAAQQSVPRTPIYPSPADSPARTESGKVFASTDPTQPPALGPEEARVLVVVFSDFQCPVCRRCADATQQIAEEFPGEVRVAFWQHALPTHARAVDAAVASLAAQRQGKFWEYHDQLFRNQSALDLASLEGHAEAVGLDVVAFRNDIQDASLRERVAAEGAVAEALGATGTPGLLINGRLRVGWGSWTQFRAEVERELSEARRLESEGTPPVDIGAARARALIADPEKLNIYLERVLGDAAASVVAKEPEPAPEKNKRKKKSRKSPAR
jgi:protein-disulfide isomerase